MKRGKNTSVKWKMVSMILLYWALPFALMLALVEHIMADRQEKTGLERMAAQLEMDNQNSIERIDSAISDSRQATYDKTLYSYYDEFRKGSVNFDTVYNKGQYYMAKQYGKRMDRKKLPEIALSEEIIYVDAYLYITSERLGKRFHVVKEMDENTMKCMVPRLIMQPVIENAVKHGVIPRGEGTVTIRSYLEDDYLILEVRNDGEISEEDQKKISRLLALDYDTSRETSLNLGIANVNQRLRILYGDQCGLTIEEASKGCVISRIRIAVGTS